MSVYEEPALASHLVDGGAYAAWSVTPYKGAGERRNRCRANGDTCKAFAVRGSEFCAGHRRTYEKQQRRYR